ncbi:Ig-like domain-containing protein [Rhodohalobacter sp. 8-1]|uniref:Ig-like domain-containing protein n=1 Tax=Rhodohalobacter sp. 8-1 TaxID=3131972 RepID=UPI0030ED54CE
MSTIINTYPVFESSQVLTSSQLNQVVSYLDQQGRLTRTQLIGMGIVCGLELSYDHSDGDHQVTISKGTAVTSEGYLIKLGKCETSWYRPYQLPDSVAYAPFDNSNPPFDLYELLQEKPEDESDVKSLGEDLTFLKNKFVLLFLETYDNDIKPCLGNTCDELGIDRIFTVRKLLISKDHLDELLEHSANVGNLYPKKFELPEIVMPRTLFDPDADHSREMSAFTGHHISSIQPVFTSFFGDKTGDGERTPGALHQTYSVYDLLLGAEYDLQNPFDSAEINGVIDNFESYLADASDSGTNTPGIQYFSDFMKDLILAYDEFQETAFELVSECCSDMSRFPKHVMLGRAVTEKESPEEAVAYRHGFVQPPIYNHQKTLMEKAMSLHKRLVLMVESFNLDRIQLPDPDGEDPDLIRITPSDEKNTPLSRRSIPFYYDIKSEGQFTGKETLEQHWNFDRSRRTGPGVNVTVLNYHNQAEDHDEIISPTETPLHYDLDSYPFLRIEGLLGRHHGEVIERLKTLQKTFNLPFDLIALQLDPDAELLNPDYSCGFEDLQEEYKTARRNYCGFTRDLMQLLGYASEHQEPLFGSDEETTEDLHSLVDISKSFQTVCKQLPECLDEFSFVDFQQSYKEALQQLLHFILIEKRLLEEIDFNEREESEKVQAINGFIQHLSPLLYRFIDLLFYNTFLRVYLSFRRREYYLQREKNVFSSYLHNHSGVDHQAGVPKGGTFVVLYNSAEEPAVIADFALPYLCCDTDRCVPMCDDGDFRVEIPPFARPDFAVTTIGRPVEINVIVNDYGMENRSFTVEIDQQETGGGSIDIDEEGTILYKPHEEYQGVDRFHYTLTDKQSGISDRGLVTVLVKEEDFERPAGCYPPEVLICWADGDLDFLHQVYFLRSPDDNRFDNIDELAKILHDSLQKTGGFSDTEIDQTEVLGNEAFRRNLLRCIDPDLPVEQMEREELGARIREYQEENCGTTRPSRRCYSLEILDCLKIDSVRSLAQQRDIDIDSLGQEQVKEELLKSLRETNGFTMNELESGHLQVEGNLRELLTCIGLKFEEDTPIERLKELLLSYQNKNCGGRRIDREDNPRTEFKESEFTEKDLRAVLNFRGESIPQDMPVPEMVARLKETDSGLQLTKEEVSLFTKDRISDILENRGLEAPSRSRKDALTNKLFGR